MAFKVPGKLRLAGEKLRLIGEKLRLIGEAVIFRHTLFSLPFAVTVILLETRGHPPLKKAVLILLAAAAGRNAANALNRVIDAEMDEKNPHTAGRHLPRRLLSKKALLLFSLVMILILVAAAALLNPLCVFLLPLAGFLIGGYSFSKRFTWLCHYWLGLACSTAVMGSFIGLTGRFALRYFVLAAAHALWVAGFDIIYALQDIDFDRREGLYSVPARFRPLGRAGHRGPFPPGSPGGPLSGSPLLAPFALVLCGGGDRRFPPCGGTLYRPGGQ
jgi:4-hydroxybenzoate polyprenyltransferase